MRAERAAVLKTNIPSTGRLSRLGRRVRGLVGEDTDAVHLPREPDQPHGHLVGMAGGSLADLNYGWCARSNAAHAARCVACQGVSSHAEPVALVGECSIPLV